MNTKANFYKSEQIRGDVLDKTPQELLIHIYDEIINKLNNVNKYIMQKNIVLKNEEIKKINNIIEMGLIAYLNPNVNKEIFNALYNFYSDSLKKLTYINYSNNTESLKILINQYKELKESFQKIIKIN